MNTEHKQLVEEGANEMTDAIEYAIRGAFHFWGAVAFCIYIFWGG